MYNNNFNFLNWNNVHGAASANSSGGAGNGVRFPPSQHPGLRNQPIPFQTQVRPTPGQANSNSISSNPNVPFHQFANNYAPNQPFSNSFGKSPWNVNPDQRNVNPFNTSPPRSAFNRQVTENAWNVGNDVTNSQVTNRTGFGVPFKPLAPVGSVEKLASGQVIPPKTAAPNCHAPVQEYPLKLDETGLNSALVAQSLKEDASGSSAENPNAIFTTVGSATTLKGIPGLEEISSQEKDGTESSEALSEEVKCKSDGDNDEAEVKILGDSKNIVTDKVTSHEGSVVPKCTELVGVQIDNTEKEPTKIEETSSNDIKENELPKAEANNASINSSDNDSGNHNNEEKPAYLANSAAAAKCQKYDLKLLQEFDKKYTDWENNFEAWKKANSHHKDRQAYERYVEQYTAWGQSLKRQREHILIEIEKDKIRKEIEEKVKVERLKQEQEERELAEKKLEEEKFRQTVNMQNQSSMIAPPELSTKGVGSFGTDSWQGSSSSNLGGNVAGKSLFPSANATVPDFDVSSVPDSLLNVIANTLGSKSNQIQPKPHVPFASFNDIRLQQPPRPAGPNPFDIRQNPPNSDARCPPGPNPFDIRPPNPFSIPQFAPQQNQPLRIPRTSIFDDRSTTSSRLNFGGNNLSSSRPQGEGRVSTVGQENRFFTHQRNAFDTDQSLESTSRTSGTPDSSNPWDSSFSKVSGTSHDHSFDAANADSACHPSNKANTTKSLSDDGEGNSQPGHEIAFVRVKRLRNRPVVKNVLIEDDTENSQDAAVIDYGHGSANVPPEPLDDISRYVERESMHSFESFGHSREPPFEYAEYPPEPLPPRWRGGGYPGSPGYLPPHPSEYYDVPFDDPLRRREPGRWYPEDSHRLPAGRHFEAERFPVSPRQYDEEYGHRRPPPPRVVPPPPRGDVTPPRTRVAPPRPSEPLGPLSPLSAGSIESDSDSLPEIIDVIPAKREDKSEDEKSRRQREPRSRPASERERFSRDRSRETDRTRSKEYSDRDDRRRVRDRDDRDKRSPRGRDYYDQRRARGRESSPIRDSESRGNSKPIAKEVGASPLHDSFKPKSQSSSYTPTTETCKPQTVLAEDILSVTGKKRRPAQILIILRGLPGSGKSYVAKLIKEREIELGGSAPRILSLDDYFMTEEVEKVVKDPVTGKDIKETVMQYDYDADAEVSYRQDLIKTVKKTVDNGFFPFVIVDSVNDKLSYFEEIAAYATKRRFQVYIAEMNESVEYCVSKNIHNRTQNDLSTLHSNWEPTPNSYVKLDVRTLLQDEAVEDVEMEDVYDTQPAVEIKCVAVQENDSVVIEENEEPASEVPDPSVKSKWEEVESEEKKKKLDGLMKKRKAEEEDLEQMSIEAWLQRNLPDDYKNRTEARLGQKRVRWADIEERREQERMRDIGFVVGHTDWRRMTDPTFGSSALTKTKFI